MLPVKSRSRSNKVTIKKPLITKNKSTPKKPYENAFKYEFGCETL